MTSPLQIPKRRNYGVFQGRSTSRWRCDSRFQSRRHRKINRWTLRRQSSGQLLPSSVPNYKHLADPPPLPNPPLPLSLTRHRFSPVGAVLESSTPVFKAASTLSKHPKPRPKLPTQCWAIALSLSKLVLKAVPAIRFSWLNLLPPRWRNTLPSSTTEQSADL